MLQSSSMATTRIHAKTPAEQNSAVPAQTAPDRRSAWRDLFAFRAAAQPRFELWLGIAAFLLVLVLWSLITELDLVHPQILPSPRAVLTAWFRLFSEASYIGD